MQTFHLCKDTTFMRILGTVGYVREGDPEHVHRLALYLCDNLQYLVFMSIQVIAAASAAYLTLQFTEGFRGK